MNSKRDIFFDNKIWQGVTLKESDLIIHNLDINYVGIPVHGNHSFKDGEDVTGKWTLDNDCELHPGCYCVMEGKDETQCKRYNPVAHEVKVALPTPPVPEKNIHWAVDGAEAKAVFEIIAPVDFNSPEMKKAIAKIKLEIAEIMEAAKVDTSKLHITFR